MVWNWPRYVRILDYCCSDMHFVGLGFYRKEGRIKMDEQTDFASVKYDEFICDCPNSWKVKIGDHLHCFPFSECNLNEQTNEILCPVWLIEEKGLEGYIVE